MCRCRFDGGDMLSIASCNGFGADSGIWHPLSHRCRGPGSRKTMLSAGKDVPAWLIIKCQHSGKGTTMSAREDC
jgi:hypothetical protein